MRPAEGRDRRRAVAPARHDVERPATGALTATRRTTPRVGVALAGYAAAIVASALTGGIVAGMAGADSVAATVAGQLGFWAVLVAVVLYETPGLAAPVARRVGLRFRWVDVPVGLVVGVATQLLVLPALYWPFRSLIDEDDLSGPARDLLDGAGGAGLFVLGVSVVVVAPVVEELFFRGLLLRSMQLRWGTTVAVAGSTVFFGATHFQPLQLPALAAAGAVFAVAAVRTGRLGTAIAVHAGFNATTFVAIGLL